MSDLEALEEIAAQRTRRVNEGYTKGRTKQGMAPRMFHVNRLANVFANAKRNYKKRPVTLPDRA